MSQEEQKEARTLNKMAAKIPPPLEHVPPANTQLPYPITPTTASSTDTDWSASTHDGLGHSGSLDTHELGEALEANQRQETRVRDLPESLRAGGGEVGLQRPTTGERKKSIEGEIPASLKIGEGVEKPATFSAQTYTLTALASPPRSTVVEAQEPNYQGETIPHLDKGKEKATAPPSDTPSPVVLTENLTMADRPFKEYSTSYQPNEIYPSGSASNSPPAPNSYPNLPSSYQQSSSVTPTPPATSTGPEFVPSSISSAGFDPSVDISSFHASHSRALPGHLDTPPVGKEGWKAEAEETVTKSWEEELDRRAKAGAEIQKRAEEAQRKEREERLQAEFWEEERKEQERLVGTQTGSIQGPPKPPKEFSQAPGPPKETTQELLIDAGEAATPAESTPPPPIPQTSNEHRPVLPIPQEPPQLPPRPSPQPSAETTTEIYQIKHISWADPRCNSLRLSPILLQNVNGPCPLLALINALILATPPNITTSLHEALSRREQVSLELLLDTVFEELMSRGKSTELPDVGDLFAFLLTLHTGMNVNPKLTPQIENGKVLPGGFEKTKEMALYSAFHIPLFHGWLPHPENPVIEAMVRRKMESYEEAQTIIWQEEEIINRISLHGGDLSPDDQSLMRDSGQIRDFLENSRTQLTAFGLEILRKGMDTGDVAILFRNDHFMTVFKEPEGSLMGLVTDMGYAGHKEVIWERIVDVNGRGNEYCSGDFRPVGGDQRPADEGWEVVNRGNRSSQHSNHHHPSTGPLPGPPPGPPPQGLVGPAPGEDSTDYDLALAIQLQEEEDEHHRRSLSHPPPRSHRPHRPHHHNQHPPPTPPRHHRAPNGEDVPPPPYERHPAPLVASQNMNMSAYQQQVTDQRAGGLQQEVVRRGGQARDMLQEIAGNAGAHRRAYSQGVGQTEKEKCVVM